MKTPFFRHWFSSSTAHVQETVEAQAERGVADAQYRLGLKFASGTGAAQDFARAAQWFLKAAEQSHPLAQFNLGVMYAEGKGVLSDKAQSMMWIERAAHLGDAGAQYRLGIIHHRASLERFPVNASESRIEAYKWLQLSDDQGYRDSDMARGLVILHMTKEEVTDGNRRAAGFVATPAAATEKAVL